MVFLQLAREIEMQNDLDVVQLLETQYQERLEEEIAKVFFLFCYFKVRLKKSCHFHLPFLTMQLQ